MPHTEENRINRTQFWRRPHLDRRLFFQHLGAAVGGYMLMPSRPLETVARAASAPINKAKNVIFVMMRGAPSHTDTFDLKPGPWLPAGFNPATFDGLAFPQGLFPALAEQIDQITLMRSVKPWVVVHELGQNWVEIGRNPISGLSRIAPHIGSVVSLELGDRTKPMPAFVNLNTATGPSSGYLSPVNAPFYVTPNGAGLPNTKHPDAQAAFERRFALMQDLDSEVRSATTLNPAGEEMEQFNLGARKLMYNPDVDKVFNFDATERARYGNTGFGNACITARNLLRAGLGTRFVQINVGGWDNHNNIYTASLNPTNAASLGRSFDAGLGTLIKDLKADGALDSTLVIAMGEFGRTTGVLNVTAGRDHFAQQSVLVAGAGTRGKRAIGATDDLGRNITEYGWKNDRPIRPEDIEATIYSALGINWLTIRRDDPFGRGFEYVPEANAGNYEPVHELWS
jgi:hypothetical protein